MTDPNIAYIWGFLKMCHERGWLYRGHRPMVWCLRCGTSLSQHEVTATDSYRDIVAPVAVRALPLASTPPDEALVVWTTTPWTLPANVAAAVKPDAELRLGRRRGRARYVVAERSRARPSSAPTRRSSASVRGAELVGRPYATGFDDLPAQAGRRAPRDRRGTTSRWTRGPASSTSRPAAAPRTSSSAAARSCPCSCPSTRPGAFVDGYGWLARRTARTRRPSSIVEHLERGGWLLREEPYAHRYPHCWRCGTKLIFRVVDEWFISLRRGPRADDRRQPHASSGRRRTSASAWRTGCATWATGASRASATGACRCRSTFCPDGPPHRRRLARRSCASARPQGLEGLQELHRPWIDPVTIALRRVRAPRPSACPRSATAGSTPASSRSRRSATAATSYEPEGFAAGAGVGLTKADLPDHAYWEKWFPADWVSEMREQIRLWFYSQLFMSVALVGPGAVPARARLREAARRGTGRAMHKSWGNAIWFDDAIEKIGADVMPLDVRGPGHRRRT